LIYHHDLNLINQSALLADVQHVQSSPSVWVTGVATVATVAALAYALKRYSPSHHGNGQELARFTNENITASFVAAIPTITRELNLEVATALQTETFTRSSAKTMLWGLVDLGTNVVQVRVPVTYRYHIRLREPWELKVQGETVLVHAPVLRASLPPAIHTDRMERLSKRGWCRGSPRQLLEQLESEITPALSEHATDPKQLDQVRHACRLSVAEFVRLWLEREGQWKPGRFTTIELRLADEATLPSDTTLKLTR
jgi:hypothetical protein